MKKAVKKHWNFESYFETSRGLRNDQFQVSPEGAAAAEGQSYRCTWSPKYIDSMKL